MLQNIVQLSSTSFKDAAEIAGDQGAANRWTQERKGKQSQLFFMLQAQGYN